MDSSDLEHFRVNLDNYYKFVTLSIICTAPTRTLAYQQSNFPRTVKQWNNLPNYIINIETIEKFDNCILDLDLFELTSFLF